MNAPQKPPAVIAPAGAYAEASRVFDMAAAMVELYTGDPETAAYLLTRLGALRLRHVTDNKRATQRVWRLGDEIAGSAE